MKRLKSYIQTALLLLFPVLCAAQTQQQERLDSMYRVLKNAANDTIRMDVCNSIGIYYGELNRDSSMWYRDKALVIARKLDLKIDEADILVGKGYINLTLRNYPKSFQCLSQAMRILENPSNEINPFHLSDGQSPATTRQSTMGVAHFVFGFLYGATGDKEKRISSYRNAINIGESIHDTTMLADTYSLLGSAYTEVGKLDSALILEQKALHLFSFVNILGDSKYEGMVLLYIAEIYQRKGNFDLAKNVLLRAIRISLERNNFANLGDSYISLAKTYQATAEYDSSLLCAKAGLETYTNLGVKEGMAEAYTLVSKIYDKLDQRDSSYRYLSLAGILKDSLNEIERKNINTFQNLGFDEQMKVQELEKERIQTNNKIRTYAMLGGLGVFIGVGLILYRNNRQKQKANKVLETTLINLKSTQSQLIQSEKMASLGELTAGIAHEIQNPLNFVNNFSDLNTELIEELKTEAQDGKKEEVIAIANDIKANEEKINQHGKRADAIVKGMLQHSRSSSGAKELTDINALAEEYLRLAYHGLRAKDHSFQATMKTDFDATIGKVNIVPQDIGRVILNLISNAFYAASLPSKGGFLDSDKGQIPTVWVSTRKVREKVVISVRDNGPGIPQKILDKIFQPFFTTKPTGQGTGLGLSLAYDIIKAHGGEIKVETKEGEGSVFIIQLLIYP